MNFDNLVYDNGLYIDKHDYFVSNEGKLLFNIHSDKKTFVISQIFCNIALESNKVIGSRNDIVKKKKYFYNPVIGFGRKREGSQSFITFEFGYVNGKAVFDDYENELYDFIKNIFYNVDINESTLKAAKKKFLSNIKSSLNNKDKYIDSVFYNNELSDSAISISYMNDIDEISKLIDTITVDDLLGFYERIISGEDFYRGYLSGDFTDEQYKYLRTVFPFKSSIEELDFKDKSLEKIEDVEIEDDMFSESIINVCYRYTGNNGYFTRLLFRILAGSNGVLHKILRSKYGLVYQSHLSSNIYNDMLYINAKIAKENKEATIDAINEVFEILHDRELLKDYFEKTRVFLETCLSSATSCVDDYNGYLEDYIIKAGNAYDILEYYNAVCSYDPDKFISELDSLEPVNTFFYKGVK